MPARTRRDPAANAGPPAGSGLSRLSTSPSTDASPTTESEPTNQPSYTENFTDPHRGRPGSMNPSLRCSGESSPRINKADGHGSSESGSASSWNVHGWGSHPGGEVRRWAAARTCRPRRSGTCTTAGSAGRRPRSCAVRARVGGAVWPIFRACEALTGHRPPVPLLTATP